MKKMKSKIKATQTFATNLRVLRAKIGLTQAQIAEMIGIESRSYQRYEIGKFSPSDEMKEKLADIFKVSVSDLYKKPEHFDPSRGKNRYEIITSLYEKLPLLRDEDLAMLLEMSFRFKVR